MKKILSILAVAAMAFTACTTDITDDVVKNESVEYATPLEFDIDLEVSRAFMDDETTIKFEAGDKVGVYVIPADPSATATKNAEGTIVMVNGKPRVSVNVASFAAGDKVLAYYPYHTQNNNNEASAITLQIPEVQVQAVLGKINCKYLPMVSVATELSAESGGTILFRPVASIMKLNIYSDDAEQLGASIRRIRFNSEKWQNVAGCNYMTGNYSGFDLTTVTANSDIAIDGAKISRTTDGDANIPYACYAFANYNGDDAPTVAASADKATPVYVILFPGTYGNKGHNNNTYSKILVYTEEFGRFDVEVKQEYEFGRAVIKPFNINLNAIKAKVGIGVDYIHTHAVDSASEATKGSIADQLINEEFIVIGSGYENPNMACAAMNEAFNSKNFNQNLRTFYVQTLDGVHGFRMEYYSAGQNKLQRGDVFKMASGNAQWWKTKAGVDANGKDVWEYYCTAFSPSNIFKLTSGCQDKIVTKEKHINELTAADLNTDVKLLDTEFVVKDAPYVTGYLTAACVGGVRDQSATMIQDKNDDALFLLINSKCTWKRNIAKEITVPQGVGSIHGVLVHTSDIAYAKDGNIGMFQLRPFDETSFDMTATKESAVNEVMSWRMDLKTVSVGKYKWNANGTFISAKQTEIASQNKLQGRVNGAWNANAFLYTTNRVLIASHVTPDGAEFASTTTYHNTTYHPTFVDGMKLTGATMNPVTAALTTDFGCGSPSTSLGIWSDVAGFYVWGEDGQWTGATNGIVAEFPGADKQMSISFSMGSMPIVRTETNKNPWVVNAAGNYRDRGTTYGFPLYWKVECSIDGGQTWTPCVSAINGETSYKLNPIMRWTSNTDVISPIDNTTKVKTTTPDDHSHQYSQQKFVLPTSAIGAAKVMVKISPASLRLAWFGKTGKRNYTDTSDVEGFDCTSTYKYIMAMCLEDVVVTTAK